MPWTFVVCLSLRINWTQQYKVLRTQEVLSNQESLMFWFFFCIHCCNLDIAYSPFSFSHLVFSAKSFGVFTSCFPQVTYPAPVRLPLPTGPFSKRSQDPRMAKFSLYLNWPGGTWPCEPLSFLNLIPLACKTRLVLASILTSQHFSLLCIGGCYIPAHVGESSLSVFLLAMWP